MSRNFLDELSSLQTELSAYSDDYHENRDDDERESEFKKTLLAILRKTVAVVHDAQVDKAENFTEVVEKAESLLNEAISLAYEGDGEEGLFTNIESFAHTAEHPLAKPPRNPEGVFCKLAILPSAIMLVFITYPAYSSP